MRAWLVALLIAVAGPVASEEAAWARMSGAEIAEALTGATVDYPNAWQDFRASGRTLYHAGRDSWGYWAVRDDQYCSMWPPSDLWACYDMTRLGESVRFVDAAGDFTEGVFRAATE